MAGAAAAAFLAPHRSVVLLEREPALATHTTGRSAAQYLENYGGPVNRQLTLASRSFFMQPPPGLVHVPLVSPRPMLTVGRACDLDELERTASEGRKLVPSIRRVSGREARRLCPALREEFVAGGVYEPDAMDIDVMALHHAFVRQARHHGATVYTSRGVASIAAQGAGWRLETPGGAIEAEIVVNAAGAWADAVAASAGLPPIGLVSLRRTAFTVAGPMQSEDWPLVYAADHSFYFKPEAGRQLLCSPADETPSEPCDARPEELDVALAIERINAATTLAIRHVRASWAGLRSFVSDRQPVVGPDPLHPAFYWVAGIGGTGIQTAPALGRLVASLIVEQAVPPDLAEFGFREHLASVARLRAA